MLSVEKIGGTSMSRFHDVYRNIILRKGKKQNLYNRVFVVSAYNHVTDWLLENKKTKASGIYSCFANQEDYESHFDDLLSRLMDINRQFEDIGLDPNDAEKFISDRIQQTKSYLSSMAEVIGTGYVDKKDILLAARELLASIGEAHSGFNTVNILKNNGINTVFIDLSGFHDSEYLTIDERVHREFKGIDFSQILPVATGYTKGTEGIMREFDRGYSEVTFSKIAVAIGADEAVIHKEYHLCSADPNIVGEENTTPVGFTNYDVADQLADIGMEAIHPKAAKPLELNGINLRIKNTFDPDHPGTLITKKYTGKQARVEMITGSDRVSVIEIHDTLMVGEVGFDLDIMKIFDKFQISYILKATNANSISLVIWDHEKNPQLIDELKSKYEVVTINDVAIICILGTNIAIPGVLAKAAEVFAENKINIECISQSLRQVNMQFIIKRDKYRNAIMALNDALH